MDAEYIDFHTHQLSQHDLIQILNCDFYNDPIAHQGHYTLGIHPWQIHLFNQNDLPEIERQLSQGNCLGLGEVGLDRCRGDFYAQTLALEHLLPMAQTIQKPLILHCVKAYSDFLQLFKRYQLSIPIIFHDYNGPIETTRQLLKYNCYFSFGARIFNKSSKAYQSMNELPIERFFFESDDQSFSVAKSYDYYSHLNTLGLSLNDVKKSIYSNFMTLFDLKAN